jgi:hypothetical protein
VERVERVQAALTAQAARQRDERLASMTAKERAQHAFLEEQQSLAAQLGALGIDLGDDAPRAAPPLTSVDVARALAMDRAAHDRALLELYDALRAAVVSVSGVTVQSGTHRLQADLRGLDLFDLLPDSRLSP